MWVDRRMHHLDNIKMRFKKYIYLHDQVNKGVVFFVTDLYVLAYLTSQLLFIFQE